MPQSRYTYLTAGPIRFVVIDNDRGGQAVFAGTYPTEHQAAANAAQLNREYERWLRESAQARSEAAPGEVL